MSLRRKKSHFFTCKAQIEIKQYKRTNLKNSNNNIVFPLKKLN